LAGAGVLAGLDITGNLNRTLAVCEEREERCHGRHR
jgi:hypothetical protein